MPGYAHVGWAGNRRGAAETVLKDGGEIMGMDEFADLWAVGMSDVRHGDEEPPRLEAPAQSTTRQNT
jgi:hypothetical protein